MSPFLIRLEKEFLSTGDERTRAEIDARRAAYLARTGNFDTAREIVARLRLIYADGRAVRITILIMVAEALIYQYESLKKDGLDKIIRAQLLSRMARDLNLEAITSAWRAHIEFENSCFAEMLSSLEAAHRCAGLCGSNEAMARVANIACKIGLLCGETTFANRQFLFGRDKALMDGDQASIEALQHNKAAFRLSRLRSSMCFGQVDAVELNQTRIEIASARSLQHLARITALSTYIDLCEAQLLIVEQRFQDAIEALNRIRSAGPFPVGSFSTQMLDLEISFCLALLERQDDAINMFNSIRMNEVESLDADELLFFRWMQLRLAEQDVRFGSIGIAKANFEVAASAYNAMIERLRDGLRDIFNIKGRLEL